MKLPTVQIRQGALLLSLSPGPSAKFMGAELGTENLGPRAERDLSPGDVWFC